MPDYPQMPPLTQAELDNFLSQPLIAKVSSLNEDGSIHTAPIYFRYDKGEVFLGTQKVTRKVQNIERNPQVTLLIDEPTRPFKGVMMTGKAYVEYDDAVARRAWIFANYMPEEGALGFAQKLASKWQPAVIRFKPDQIVSFDYSKGSLFD